MALVVAEDGARTHPGHLGDLIDRGVETSPGDDFHRRSPDARSGELALLLGQRRRGSSVRDVHKRPTFGLLAILAPPAKP